MKRAIIVNTQGSFETENNGQNYKKKCEYLERQLVELIHVNGALCRTIQSNEEKINSEKLERKFLLKKLLQYEGPEAETKHENTHSTKSKISLDTDKKLKSSSCKSKNEPPKASKNGQSERSGTPDCLVQPIPVNNYGHPIFPIELQEVSIYSIGEVVHDRSSYHNKEFIYPVGFCSTREFSSLSDQDIKCLYTCKILDGGNVPLFEISPEDQPTTVFACHNVNEAFLALKTTFEKVHNNFSLSNFEGSGHEFFGMTQPIVKNLIQSMPGSRKCTKYIWTKFDVVKPKSVNAGPKNNKPSCSDINIEALEKWANEKVVA